MSHPVLRAQRTPAGRQPTRQPSQGFTLVELVITVAVASILVALALPSFQSVMVASRINSQANEFVATLQLARMEAVRRNARVVVCPSTDGATCQTGNPTAWTGWVAYVDDGGFSHAYASGNAANANNNAVDANETILRSGSIPPNVGVKTSTSVSGSTGGAITFRSDGLARDSTGALLGGRISVCVATAHPPENARNVMIMSGGRIAVERAVMASCGTPGNGSS